jgi:predicted N-acetyltransferase YhbS
MQTAKSSGAVSAGRVRIATPADVARMTQIINAAFSIEAFIEGSRMDDVPMSELMRKGEFLVAEDDSGRVLGCVYTELRGERAYFGMLSVDPSLQGTGLGRFLVKAAEDHCRERGCRWMDISVLSPRTELLPFYGKFGYVESGRKEFHTTRRIRNGVECHLILMSKEL